MDICRRPPSRTVFWSRSKLTLLVQLRFTKSKFFAQDSFEIFCRPFVKRDYFFSFSKGLFAWRGSGLNLDFGFNFFAEISPPRTLEVSNCCTNWTLFNCATQIFHTALDFFRLSRPKGFFSFSFFQRISREFFTPLEFSDFRTSDFLPPRDFYRFLTTRFVVEFSLQSDFVPLSFFATS